MNMEKKLPLGQALQAKIDGKTKPLGALGEIEALALKIGLLQSSLSPRMETCSLTIFAADHGMAAAGVSAFPQAVTQQMVLNFLAGGAAANVFANTLGINVQVVDAGVAGAPIRHSALLSRRIATGTQNAIERPAMRADQCEKAIKLGEEIGRETQTDAACFGEMGIGNTSAAALLAHKVLGLPLEDLTGCGTGLKGAGLARKGALLAKAAQRTPARLCAKEALTEYGGFEIAMMAGAMIGAAKARKLVLVDGFIATAAALIAARLDPSITPALVYAHMSEERGHKAIFSALGAKPLLDLRLRLGEGTGALLAWPLVQSAAAMLNDMASFESAGVSGKSA